MKCQKLNSSLGQLQKDLVTKIKK